MNNKLFKNQLKLYIKEIYNEYYIHLLIDKIKLLKQVCDNENLNFDSICHKYFSCNDLTIYNNQKDIVSVNNIIIDNIYNNMMFTNSYNDVIFNNIVINNKKYYYQPKNYSDVYDASGNIIGIYKDNKIILD